MAEIKITKNNFQREVLQAGVPVLLDFWAAWCGPCRMLSGVISEVAAKAEGKYKVGKVNVDEEPELHKPFHEGISRKGDHWQACKGLLSFQGSGRLYRGSEYH